MKVSEVLNFDSVPRVNRSQGSFHLSFVTASILGNYARVGLSTLSNYQPSYVSGGSILWSNLSSCMFMGTLQVLKQAKWFEDERVKPLFVVLTTGFCGAFSSYSTMMLEIFLHSTSLETSNIAHGTKLPNRAYGIMEFLSVLLTQLLVSMGAYLFGRGAASSIIVPFSSQVTNMQKGDEVESIEDEAKLKSEDWKLVPKPWVIKTLLLIHWTFSLLAIPLVALIIVLTCVYGNYSRGIWTLPQIFGIFGSYLRFELANWFNSQNNAFPLGTFIANEFAVILIAVFQVIYRGRRGYGESLPIASTPNQCHISTALISGFCGSLSTISTFINEGYKLEFVEMLVYYGTTISVSYCFIVIILGSYAWTRGLTEPLC